MRSSLQVMSGLAGSSTSSEVWNFVQSTAVYSAWSAGVTQARSLALVGVAVGVAVPDPVEVLEAVAVGAGVVVSARRAGGTSAGLPLRVLPGAGVKAGAGVVVVTLGVPEDVPVAVPVAVGVEVGVSRPAAASRTARKRSWDGFRIAWSCATRSAPPSRSPPARH